MNLIRDGTYASICKYNAGFPLETDEACTSFASPDDCTRSWDRSETPKGILAEAISSGYFKWCVHEAQFGPAKDGLIDTATKDDFLQNIKKGELFGIDVDYFNALTIAMSKILHAKLMPELVKVEAEEGRFEDMVNAMADDKCYATLSFFFCHPYRESKADFTCATQLVGEFGFGIVALSESNIDLEDVFDKEGKGVTICTSSGSTQESLAKRDFPQATFVDVGSVNSYAKSLCDKECDAVVDDLNQFQDSFNNECGGKELDTPFGIAAPSLAHDVGAVTYRTC